MPVITVEAAKLSKEQKRKLVQELTESASNIMNIPQQAFFVFVKENDTENIGVAGQLIADRQQSDSLKSEENNTQQGDRL
ncbi:4-oxalocrotonate tautomerase [Paenibacillus sp. SZ31]|jgi:4-oxalocrotonate tautomerase|uniref:4-oxalocrotonate tautomerase DmpI n=1 Tax=unclassified Paenibacillus TaxID=185978 RepID=UPI00146A52DC|nr:MULTISPECIES: 4-oxalocrotonate tautomerase DmpI [unclassified Paenibacillus]MCW3790140.1 4-oxalocrotonate tautomerase family protein [Paenibacillus sp. LS1]NMI03541.1 4-oxalocrotonate tautomerase [Paenibacillus sp. SZ31]